MSKNLVLRKRIKRIIGKEDSSKPVHIPQYRSPLTSPKSEANIKLKDLRSLLKEDIKRTIDLHSSNYLSRDISHLQDKKLNSMISLPILPTDIDMLRKLKVYPPNIDHQCKREPCLNEATFHRSKRSETSESIEKMLGNPTGRQDIKELCTWFTSMLSFHSNAGIETIELIYEQCAKELTRQVAVTCVERGELLQILFKYQSEVYNRKKEELETTCQNKLERVERELKSFKEKAFKKQKELEIKSSAYFKLVEVAKVEKEKIMDELHKCKHRYNEFARKFMEEEKAWQQKHLALLMKLKENYRPVKISNHELSVVNWMEKQEEGQHEFDLIQKEMEEYQDLVVKSQIDTQEFMVQEEVDGIKMLELYEEKINEELIEELKENEENDENEELGENKDLEENLTSDNPNQELNENENEPKANPDLLQASQLGPPAQDLDSCSNPLESATQTSFALEVSETVSVSLFSSPPELQLVAESYLELLPGEQSKPDLPSPRLKSVQSRKAKKRLAKPGRAGNTDLHQSLKATAEPASKPELSNPQAEETPRQATEQASNASNAIPTIEKLRLGSIIRDALNPLVSAKSASISPMASADNPTLLSPPLVQSSKISPRSGAEDEGFSLNDLKFIQISNLMPDNCDVFSWKTGFSLGFEQGRKEGLQDGEVLGIELSALQSLRNLQGKEQVDEEAKEEKMKPAGNLALRSSIFKKKVNEVTKVMQFQFARNEGSKKQHPVHTLITKLLISGLDVFRKCTLSRKVINKIISSVLVNSLSRQRNGEVVDSLVEQLYDDFYQKYGLKAVCEKRFVELLSSLFAYSGFRRVSVFIRLLGFGGRLGLKNYSGKTFKFYLSCLSFMMTSKVGVIIVFDDIADKQMFPTQRALECLKEKIENWTDKGKLAEFVNELMASTEQDSKGLNALGLVELELVLQIAADAYEEFLKQVEKGIEAVFEGFGLSDSIFTTNLAFVLRAVYPDRFDFSEEVQENPKKTKFFSIFPENKEFSIQDLTQKCLDLNLLRFQDLENFFPSTSPFLSYSSLKEFWSEYVSNLHSTNILYRIKSECSRLLSLFSNLPSGSNYSHNLAISLVNHELSRIKSDLPLIY